jgi:hypothetical protein
MLFSSFAKGKPRESVGRKIDGANAYERATRAGLPEDWA